MQEKEAWSPLKLQSGNHFGILQVPVKLPPGELCQAAQRCLQQRGSRLCPRNAAVPSPPGASPAPRGTLLLGRSPNSSRARERCVGSTRRLSSSVTSPGRSCGESRGSRVSPGAGGDGKEPQECCLSCPWPLAEDAQSIPVLSPGPGSCRRRTPRGKSRPRRHPRGSGPRRGWRDIREWPHDVGLLLLLPHSSGTGPLLPRSSFRHRQPYPGAFPRCFQIPGGKAPHKCLKP